MMSDSSDDAGRVVVVGDVMLDSYLHGQTSRISPEAPVPVLHVAGTRSMPGGAANAAANIAALGLAVDLVAPIGDDDAGGHLTGLIDANAGLTFSPVLDRRGTISKLRYSSRGQQLLRIDTESTAELTPEAMRDQLRLAKDLIPASDVVVLSDYAKGALDKHACQAILLEAAENGVPCVVDPKGSDFSRYSGAFAITPNEAELALACGRRSTDLAAIVEDAQRLAHGFDFNYVVATRGKDGVIVVDRDGLVLEAPSSAKEVYDVSGAGDSFVAGLTSVLAGGGSIEEAVAFGNKVAGIAVGKSGTSLVRRDEIDCTVDLGHESRYAPVTRDYLTLASITETWRSGGEQVGFTNGVFDLLHSGHLRTIEASRRSCDRLVVAVNSDSSVKALKGPTRPVQDEDLRAMVLSRISDVDLVFIFDAETPIDAIQAVQPDVLIKGGDYHAPDVVGYDLVVGRGGEVKIVPTLDGYSTTSTIARIR